MGATGREPDATLIDALRAAPETFDFLQAVRVIERAAALRARDPRYAVPEPVGFDHDPRHETVQLRVALELAFPAAEVASYDDSGQRPRLWVTLMGLNGVSGALPAHYSQLVLEADRNKNTALRDFLDLFNHRALSLFVRAARKYRLPLEYEHVAGAGDAITTALRALVGIRSESLQRRLAVPDEVLVFYGGHFARRPRTATALEQLLSDHFERAVRVLQFQGRWVGLPTPERTRLGGSREDPSRYATLGRSALVGAHYWDVNGSFRVRVGPLDYGQFQGFMPDGTQMSELAALTRSYVGIQLSFDVQLTLLAAEVPPLVLGGDDGARPRLGWNTWLPAQRRGDASDAIFQIGES
jgi:type VI secretion system protein ImpH